MKNAIFRRIFSITLIFIMVLTVLPVQPRAAEFDKENFKGLLVKAESNITMVFYKGHTREAEDKIQPDFTETIDGITYYYFAGISGSYCYDAKRTGDYTIYQKQYITSAEAKTCCVEEVKMNKRAGEWDHTYYYGNTTEYLNAVENDMSEKWHTEVALITPVFTNKDKPAHQMTTQPELEAFIAQRDDKNDNMYVFSMGRSSTYDLDIPIVFFTKTDLSECTTLEQIAQALQKDGLPNVGYKAQMHGDEHAAGEGALGVIDLLDKEENQYLLEDINIYVIPRMNPDGGYKCKRNMITAIDPSFTNRDPNRDMLVLNLMEQRYYLKTVQLFDPIVELDGHERQRGNTTADIEIGTSWRYDSVPELLDVQTGMVFEMFDALEAVDLSGGWYSTNVNTAAADNTRSFAGAQGRIHILMESRGIYLGNEAYGSRTASHIVSVMAALKYTANNRDAIIQALDKEQQKQIKAGQTYEETEQIALISGKVPSEKYTITTEKTNAASGKITIIEQIPNIYTPTSTRTAPTAYVIPADLPQIGQIIELMDLQEIAYEYMAPGTAIALQQYTGVLDDADLTAKQTYAFPNGCYVFQMNQANAYVLALLMEPDCSSQNLVRQNRITSVNGLFPIYRYTEDLVEGSITYTTAQAAPEGVVAVDATVAGNDGKITGLQADKLYEYKVAGGEYVKLPAGTTTVENLVPGTYYIRYQTAGDIISLDAVCTVGCKVTVYVSTAGNDDNVGTSEDAPVTTLVGAYNALDRVIGTAGTAAEGKIVLLDDITIQTTARLDLPTHTYPVTITGKTQSVKLIYDPQSMTESTQQIAFHGPTTLDGFTFHAASSAKLDYIFACGNKMVIGENLITTSARTTFPILVAGDYKTGVANTDLTIRGGKWNLVYAGNFMTGHSGTAKLTVDGGILRNAPRTHYSGDATGNYEIYLSGVTLETPFYCGTYSSGSISGDVKLTLGKDITGTIYTGARKAGSMNGTATVIDNGADLTKLTLINAPGTDNTTGKVNKAVLVYAEGETVAVEGFHETHIITADTVTLGSDLTVDKIAGGGNLELNGHNLTGEDVYAMAAEIKSVSLRPGAAGLYFTASFELHEELSTSAYGVALSVTNQNPEARENTGSLYTTGYNSVLVKDIMKSGSADNTANAQAKIYARAYVKLSDGTIIYSETVAVTLQQLVMAADSKWGGLKAAQQQTLLNLYEAFATEMAGWKIPNIKENA